MEELLNKYIEKLNSTEEEYNYCREYNIINIVESEIDILNEVVYDLAKVCGKTVKEIIEDEYKDSHHPYGHRFFEVE